MIGSNLWDQVLSRIEAKVNRHSFYTWFKPTSFVDEREGRVQVRVPNTLFRDWLTKHYSAVIDEAFTELDRPGTAIVFVTDETVPAPIPPPDPPAAQLPVEQAATEEGALSVRFSFDTLSSERPTASLASRAGTTTAPSASATTRSPGRTVSPPTTAGSRHAVTASRPLTSSGSSPRHHTG